MKCKKHPEDHSSSGGVCASCLRQRLIALIAAQSEAAEGNHFKEDQRESDANPPPPLIFPRSVSPYISRRKSDTAPPTQEFRRRDHVDTYNCLPDRKFFSTPQIGPAGRIIVDDNYRDKRKGNRKFWFSSLFRSKSAVTNTDLDPRPSESGETPSRSWFSSVIPRRKQLRTCSLDDSTVRSNRRKHRSHGRGMSPANNCSDDESDVDNCNSNVETSGSNTEELKQTPRRTPGRNGGARRSHLSRNVSDIVFCLSPLVRPSPNRIWNQKGGGLPPEIGVAGEARVPVKSSNLSGGSFCKNRSRKLADFGRCKRNH